MKTLVSLFSVTAVLALAAAVQADDFRNATDKALGHYSPSARTAQTQRYYPAQSYSTQPVVADNQQAAPAERQSQSVEPSKPATAHNAPANQAPTTVRSYSVEPAMTYAPAATYRHRQHKPSYMLQKTDPNRYSTN